MLNPGGVSPTIGVGQHSGVEPRIRVVYENGQGGSDCEPDHIGAEEREHVQGVFGGGNLPDHQHDGRWQQRTADTSCL